MLSNAVLPLIKQNKRAMEEETLKTACEFPLLFYLNGPYTGVVISGQESTKKDDLFPNLYKERIFLEGEAAFKATHLPANPMHLGE